ncbi:histidine kinase dimerization/phosphoacceptor domain -containing protein [Bradyrhizobium sp.]|uniref:sensor histidine kinase n=1 Tax=Bradyrhizobium sp. TaxID=376 RepID=UPI0025C1A0A6|nr:histidine kinase dimerization/phosphoacceptor domain -containing protein [Bradyrhizobium sp.]
MKSAERLRRHPWFGYVFGAVAFSLALSARFGLEGTLPPGYPFLTFFPAVILTTFVGGVRAGIVCAVVGGLASWYWFIPPFDSFAVDGAAALALIFYAFIVGIDILLIHLMNESAARLEHERGLTAGLNKQLRTMFQELQHRVANNMMFVAGLLALQKRKVGGDPEAARTALEDAQNRVMVMSRIHRRLYDPSAVNIPAGRYFQELCADLLDATGAKNVVCLVDAPAISFDVTRLVTLSLIVTEVVTNSLKHAFAEGQKGSIAITLERLDQETCALNIQDDGRGLPADFDPGNSKSLGFKIMQSLAEQVQGKISYATVAGTRVRLVFAA